MTSALLSRCAQGGVLVYLCDGKHLPCGVLTGYHSHCRQFEMLQSQINLKSTLKKHLWQDIVVQKIKNQAQVLKLLELDGYDDVLSMSKKVKSDDADNIEAAAASKYFKSRVKVSQFLAEGWILYGSVFGLFKGVQWDRGCGKACKALESKLALKRFGKTAHNYREAISEHADFIR